MINANHPNLIDFKKNEIKTLQHLSTRRLLKAYPKLDEQVKFALADYGNKKRLANIPFEFHAEFTIVIGKIKHRVFIEGKISEKNGNYDEATYSLSITGQNDPNELIRKFHFDHAHPAIKTNTLVPIFHLQYGGTLSPKMVKKKLNDSKLEHWLSEPRLIFPPVNLALLLDMTFSEFRNEEMKKLTEQPEWRDMVFDNENFLLKAYYCGIAEFCTKANYSKNRLLRDFFYGQAAL